VPFVRQNRYKNVLQSHVFATNLETRLLYRRPESQTPALPGLPVPGAHCPWRGQNGSAYWPRTVA